MAEIRHHTGHRLPVRTPRAFPVHEGKRFLVTGAGGGIGQATVDLLVREGARVVAADVVEQTALADRLGGAERGVHAIAVDLRDETSVRDAAARSVELLGGIDGLANVAGIVKMAPALDHERPLWEDQFAVNVFGPFDLARLVVRHMIEQGVAGAVVNVASEAGKQGHPGMIAYNASKAAVINWTRVAAAEWAPHGINVNCVCPGGVATAMLHQVADNHARGSETDAASFFEIMSNEQLGRHIDPTEVASVISFLLTDRVQAVRGQSVNVDGGGSPY
ncbi:MULTISPECIES: SDR family NAD(P)-dependent oxidoreductase [Actinomadura]|uniref:SDR family NAD(P)-dependent oxidoreductase n=1 Tax=Actinomadura yumaensis TaxID=111807 RepID=A0ABW2CFC7_9ACTN|nr:SDR family oxidoreductase [Actinomadura sp. J1-007]MWK35600.1 SDR family NAD(P)-dependent oxidoreductase [Actinomadura sp. J1-007]